MVNIAAGGIVEGRTLHLWSLPPSIWGIYNKYCKVKMVLVIRYNGLGYVFLPNYVDLLSGWSSFTRVSQFILYIMYMKRKVKEWFVLGG